MKKRRLAPDSNRDLDWQVEEYRRVMGEEAAERQELAAKLERGDCTCNRQTVKVRGVFRTLHDRGCSKWKPYMEDVRNSLAHERKRDSGWTPS